MVPFRCRQEMDQTSGLILTDGDWITNSYRKLFFDFHTQLTAVDVAKGFDVSSNSFKSVQSMYRRMQFPVNTPVIFVIRY